MALNSFGTSGTSYAPGGVRQRSFAPLTGGARPPVAAPTQPQPPTVAPRPPQQTAPAIAPQAQNRYPTSGNTGIGGGQQGGYQPQNSWMPNQQQVQQSTGGWISNPEQRWAQTTGALPYGPGMSAGENKFNLLQYLTQNGPSAQKYAEGLPNTANLYNQNLGGAQGAIGGGFNSAYQGPQGNPYFPGAGGGGGGPQSPNIQGAPTNYNYQNQNAPGYQAPQFGQAQMRQFDPNSVQGPGFTPQQGFDPNSVQGPSVGQVNAPQNNFSGPNVNTNINGPSPNVPGFRDILSLSNTMSGNAGNVPREQLSGSGFEQNQNFNRFNNIAGQGLQSGLGAAQSLAQGGGFGIDAAALDKAAQRQYELAAQAGANKAIGRGFSPSGGSIGGREIGQAVADEAGRQAIQRQQLILQAEGQRQQGRIAGANALQGIGGTAGGLSGDQANRLMNESQFLGQGGLTQRGQDIQQGQFNTGQGTNNLQALTGLAGTLGGLDINSFEAGTGRAGTLGGLQNDAFGLGTTRGLGVGEQDLRAQQLNQQGLLDAYGLQTGRAGTYGNLANQNQQLNQQGQIDAYNAQTNRMGQQGDIYNQGVSNYNTAFGNETQRGQVGANAQADYNNLGFNYANMNTNAGLDYARLGAGNQNAYNQQLIDLFNAQGNQYNQGQQNQQGWADLYQQGQIAAGNQGLNQGQFGLDFLNSMAGNQNNYNNLLAGANSQDVGNFWNQYMNQYNQAQSAQINRENNRFNPGQAVTNLAGGFLSGGGLFGGGGQQQAQQYGGYQGIPRQQLQYGGW